MILNRLSLILILFFISSQLLAQAPNTELKPADPASVGMSAERLQLLDGFIQEYIDLNWFPGGEFLIARQGKIVYYKTFGHQTPEKIKRYQHNDIYRLASMTKAITTVSIMQLYEQGKLGLDDPIHYYIPAFKNAQVLEMDSYNEKDTTYTTVPANPPITIRNLLTHTSGITYGAFNQDPIRAVYDKYGMLAVGLSHPEWSTEIFIDKLAEVPLTFQPGERYSYGLNMDVLGRIVEVVSEMSLSEYFRQNIFEPLGMEDTGFYQPEKKHNRIVPVYTQDQEKGIHINEDPIVAYPKMNDNNHYAGGGGLSGTAMDYAKFIQALVNGGTYNGQRILGRKAIEVMTADQLMLQNAEGKGFSKLPGITYGLGFALTTEEGTGWTPKSAGTYEWGGYFNTKFFIDPSEELIFVGMSQIVPFYHQEFWGRVYALVYSAVE